MPTLLGGGGGGSRRVASQTCVVGDGVEEVNAMGGVEEVGTGSVMASAP